MATLTSWKYRIIKTPQGRWQIDLYRRVLPGGIRDGFDMSQWVVIFDTFDTARAWVTRDLSYLLLLHRLGRNFLINDTAETVARERFHTELETFEKE